MPSLPRSRLGNHPHAPNGTGAAADARGARQDVDPWEETHDMFERTRRFQRDSTPAQSDNGDGAVATATEPAPPAPTTTRRDRAAGAVLPTEEARLRQREEFGGINWGSAFFGWIVAIGIGVLLTAIVSAAGAAIG